MELDLVEELRREAQSSVLHEWVTRAADGMSQGADRCGHPRHLRGRWQPCPAVKGDPLCGRCTLAVAASSPPSSATPPTPVRRPT